jgi:hypothetical protein
MRIKIESRRCTQTSARQNKLISALWVSFLTATLTHCAMIKLGDSYEDPIERAAESVRNAGSEGDNHSLQEAAQMREAVIEHASLSGDLVLGMNKYTVVSVWGNPTEIQTAGEPGSQNEKWIYSPSVSRRLRAPAQMSGTKVVFFESGRVAGWETPH